MLVTVQLPPGLFRSNTEYDSPGNWYDMNLVRWQGGHMRPIGGWQRKTGTPLDSPGRKMLVWRDNANTELMLVGTDGKLYADQGDFEDITPVGFSPPQDGGGLADGFGMGLYGAEDYGDARESGSVVYLPYTYWSMANWGEDVILTANTDGKLYYYDATNPADPPEVIADAPEGNNCVVVTNERHVMCIGSGGDGGSPRRVAWSSREDHTDWDYGSTTNTAGFQELDSKTPLLRGVKVREGILIFSYSEIFLAEYVGQPFVYGFRKIGETALMHPDSIATFDGKAAWLSKGGFQVYANGGIQPLACDVLEDILSSMDPVLGPYKVHASANGIYPEIWFFYPESGEEEANRVVIWNYAENTFAWGGMERTSMVPADVHSYPYASGADGHIYEHENGWTDAGATRVPNVWIRSGRLKLGTGERSMEIKQAIAATGFGYDSLSLSFYSNLTPEGSERTFGPYLPRSDGYTDVRVSGRDVAIQWTATQDTDWSVGLMRMDVSEGGRR